MQCNVKKSITQFCGLVPSTGERQTHKQGKGWGKTHLYMFREEELQYCTLNYFSILQVLTFIHKTSQSFISQHKTKFSVTHTDHTCKQMATILNKLFKEAET